MGSTRRAAAGFTLAELLIALAILGVIATFTIPKVIQSQTNSRYNAEAKEAAGFVSDAYRSYQLSNGVSGSFGIFNLTPYLNYVRIDSTTTIDDIQGNTTLTCGALFLNCLQL